MNSVDSSSASDSLAGVDDILSGCTDFLLGVICCTVRGTSYADVGHFTYIRQVSVCDIRVDRLNFISAVSALLVTGRSGAGKTSIVQAVAKSLQQDP
jgi:peroxin-1